MQKNNNMRNLSLITILLFIFINLNSQDFLGFTSNELRDALSNFKLELIEKNDANIIFYTTDELIQGYYIKNDIVVMHITQYFDKNAIFEMKRICDSQLEHISGEDSTWIDSQNKLKYDLSIFYGLPTFSVRKLGDLSIRALRNKDVKK